MTIVNEKHEVLSPEDFRSSLGDLTDVPLLTEDELEDQLQSSFSDMPSHILERNQFAPEFAASFAPASFPGVGSILKKIKNIICAVLNAGSTTQEIIDAILAALGTIGGAIIGFVVKLIIKFVISKGIPAFCAV